MHPPAIVHAPTDLFRLRKNQLDLELVDALARLDPKDPLAVANLAELKADVAVYRERLRGNIIDPDAALARRGPSALEREKGQA